MKGFVTNIETETLKNEAFRRVLYTAKNSQLVVMSIAPSDDIGEEVHDVDQFIRIEKGKGQSILNDVEGNLTDGSIVVIPVGVKHNIKNTSTTEPLKLYTLYSPPHHEDAIIHQTKADAEEDTEHFEGKTTDDLA